MKVHTLTEQVIAAMLDAPLFQDFDLRQRHLYRESLRSLVRLAKTEQVADMKMSVRKLLGAGVAACYVERLHKSDHPNFAQGKFEFE